MRTNIESAAVAGVIASNFSQNSALGFIVIGVISFCLGVSVAVFCFRLKKWKDEEDSQETEE